MNEILVPAGVPSPTPAFNWWKLGFVTMLLAFEVTRELLVLSAAAPAEPVTRAYLSHFGGYVQAKGTWRRIDGGGALVPGTVTIDCRKDTGRCIEASVMLHERYAYAPEVESFDADFAQDSVTYENDLPDCAHYSVRLDLKLQKAFAVRERKPNPSNPNCASLEQRIEMQLGDGLEPMRNPFTGHFVPILSGIAALMGED